MNQVEAWFSILQRRILKHGDFPTAEDTVRKVAGFVSLETGPLDAPRCGRRLRKVSAEDWCVEMRDIKRWEKTPNVSPRGNMVAAICDLFNQHEDGTL